MNDVNQNIIQQSSWVFEVNYIGKSSINNNSCEVGGALLIIVPNYPP